MIQMIRPLEKVLGMDFSLRSQPFPIGTKAPRRGQKLRPPMSLPTYNSEEKLRPQMIPLREMQVGLAGLRIGTGMHRPATNLSSIPHRRVRSDIRMIS